MQKRQIDGTGEEKTVRERLAAFVNLFKFIFAMVMPLLCLVFLKQDISSLLISPLSPLLPPLSHDGESQPLFNADFISDD